MIRKLLSLSVVASALALLPVPPAMAQDGRFPKPSLYPVSWELRFNHDTPRRISVEVPGERVPKAFWYMTYQVTNLGDRERMFLPVFELMTDDGQVRRSDRNIPPAVFEAIKARHGNPLLMPALRVAGPLLVGPEQTRYGVAIWPEPGERVPGFTIFVAGLSGETATVTGGDGKPLANEQGEPFVLRKTLQLTFTTRGDEFFAGQDRVERTDKQWIMR
jgi:hypothetical protein